MIFFLNNINMSNWNETFVKNMNKQLLFGAL